MNMDVSLNEVSKNTGGLHRNNIYINTNFNKNNSKVLVNPNFNIRPHINPNFKSVRNQNIYVNPSIFLQKPTTETFNISTKLNEVNTFTIAHSTNTVKDATDPRIFKIHSGNVKTIISTKNKLIRKYTTEKKPALDNSILTSKYKFVRVNVPRDNTIHMKNIAVLPSVNKLKIDHRHKNKFSKFKLDNNKNNKMNKLKIDHRNINKIMHRSKYKLNKKATLLNLDLQHQVIKSTKRKFSINKTYFASKLSIKTEKKKHLNLCGNRMSLARSYARNKVKINSKILKKDNNPCLIYIKTGICGKNDKGICTRMHNPNQINMCPRFLQGACHVDKCLLSHLISPQKMPTCKFYLEGMCTKDNCSYTHIKLSKNSDICRQFLSGYCGRGVNCFKRHQFLCPMFEKYKVCHNKRCHYPHGYSESNYKNKIVNKIARSTSKVIFPSSKEHVKLVKHAKTTARDKKYIAENSNVIENVRYYQGENEDRTDIKIENTNEVTIVRPKLGSLPSFIPLG